MNEAADSNNLTFQEKFNYLLDVVPPPHPLTRWTDVKIYEMLSDLGVSVSRVRIQQLRSVPGTTTSDEIRKGLETIFGVRHGHFTNHRVWEEDMRVMDSLLLLKTQGAALLARTGDISQEGRMALEAVARLTTGIVTPSSKPAVRRSSQAS